MSATLEECELWKMAVDEELRSLSSTHTWVCDDTSKAQPLPTHVITKVKRYSNGSVQQLKARIVTGGNFQVFGENFVETYAPVVSFTAVRMFRYIAVQNNMYREQLDVITAFLNGALSNDFWVESLHGIFRCSV